MTLLVKEFQFCLQVVVSHEAICLGFQIYKVVGLPQFMGHVLSQVISQVQNAVPED